MDHPAFIVCSFMENSIGLKRVKSQHLKKILNVIAEWKISLEVNGSDLFTFMNFKVFGCNTIYGPQREKTCLGEFANNTGADQPAHARSLISAFVVCFSESSVC